MKWEYKWMMKLKPLKYLLLRLPYIPFSKIVRNIVLEEKRKKILEKRWEKEMKS